MLESLYWQSFKGSNCIQFLCEVYYSDYEYYLENKMMEPSLYYGVRPVMRPFISLAVRGPGMYWVYHYSDNDEDYFMYFLGLKED